MLDDVFYAPADHIQSDTIILDGDERRHLVTVTRHTVGAKITIADGAGTLYESIIDRIGKNAVECRILSSTHLDRKPTIVLGVGLLKNPSRVDLLVEKAAELGVAVLVPLTTTRVQIHRVKTDHWQKIALAAMKQSGRAHRMAINPLTTFEEFVATLGEGTCGIIPHEKLTRGSLLAELRGSTAEDFQVCVGPEGGFTEAEVQRAVEKGFRPVSLGSYKLRTETAALATVAAIALRAVP